MRLLRQLVVVFAVLAVLGGIVLLFSYDVIKLDWISFMEIQPSYRPMEDPRPVPVRSIPIEGADIYRTARPCRQTRSRRMMPPSRAARNYLRSIVNCVTAQLGKGPVPSRRSL